MVGQNIVFLLLITGAVFWVAIVIFIIVVVLASLLRLCRAFAMAWHCNVRVMEADMASSQLFPMFWHMLKKAPGIMVIQGSGEKVFWSAAVRSEHMDYLRRVAGKDPA